MRRIIIILFALVFLTGIASAVLMSDQGTDVRDKNTGNLLDLGNLTILVYDVSSGGSALYNQTFPEAIANGSWNLMISPNLEYGKSYWKDYEINGENLAFDGNDRLEFQSSLGMINNASFINFSLISSCSTGSSIRLIYENGSVECETDDSVAGGGGSLGTNGNYLYNDSSYIYFNETQMNNTIDSRSAYTNGSGISLTGKVFSLTSICSNNQVLKWNSSSNAWECSSDAVGSTDLTNYALKNQSEIFSGNITTSETGFFGFLGSLLQRITKLFVTDIDASGNVDVGGNVSVTGNVSAAYFVGDGSLLQNLPAGFNYTHLSNFTDNLGNRGYTSLSNFTNNLGFVNSSDLVAYNETSLILSVNTTSNVMSLGFYNSSQVNSLIASAGNASFNQSLTDTLYYAVSNPSNFINATTGQIFNDTNYINGLLNSYLQSSDQRFNETSLINSVNNSLTNYYLATNPSNYWNDTFATFNKTYADTLYASISVTGDNSSWNESYADTKYSAIQWGYNMTTPAVNEVLGFGYYNSTNLPAETDSLWNGNSTLVPYLASSNTFTANQIIKEGNLTINSSASNPTINLVGFNGTTMSAAINPGLTFNARLGNSGNNYISKIEGYADNTGSGHGNIRMFTGTSNLVYNSVPILTLLYNNSVGINTASPAVGYSLDVNGAVKISTGNLYLAAGQLTMTAGNKISLDANSNTFSAIRSSTGNAKDMLFTINGTDVLKLNTTGFYVNNAQGVTASGTSCTITAITNGIITGATCV